MSETNTSAGPPFQRRQLIIVAGVFAILLAILALAYMLFLRPEYRVLYADLRAADAAAIVAELDARGIAYRLRDNGTTILVPEDESDTSRLAIAGSEAGAKGLVGFELFNESDMGLTNFAQKINYQRALQGELVRTIMMMDGVESARVHLAIPERALFRGERSQPKAAVTIAMKDGRQLVDARVTGIQRLVAAAVPDLPERQVVVLDELGAVISSAPDDSGVSAVSEEDRAAALYYRARIRGAVSRAIPGLQFSITVRIVPGTLAGVPGTEDDVDGVREAGAGRDFGLDIRFGSSAPLNEEDQQVARAAINEAVVFDPTKGDGLSFEIGLADDGAAPPRRMARLDESVASPAPPAPAADWQLPTSWFWIIAALVAAAAILVFRPFARREMLSRDEHDSFADQLRNRLNLAGEDADAAR
ncbi:flagellar M-ring protein FliF [Sphingomonas gilva]|uniref:Flagellar M-ring protein FliF n=1 Tax=Sphingomonas gilva TaxID=2305907 RepID=A0A396RU48_9SPHN|nr:flagellar basal-body MS-ring/collar protein FliF [Sphingomonas gilva]RHW18962.1 flagellar M-ring protein FliF [Sphingomonas gilva]